MASFTLYLTPIRLDEYTGYLQLKNLSLAGTQVTLNYYTASETTVKYCRLLTCTSILCHTQLDHNKAGPHTIDGLLPNFTQIKALRPSKTLKTANHLPFQSNPKITAGPRLYSGRVGSSLDTGPPENAPALFLLEIPSSNQAKGSFFSIPFNH